VSLQFPPNSACRSGKQKTLATSKGTESPVNKTGKQVKVMPAQPLMCQAKLSPVAGEPRFREGAQIQSSKAPCFCKEMTSPALTPTQLGTKAVGDASRLRREPNPSQTNVARPATSSCMPGILQPYPGLKALLLPFYVMGRHQKQPNSCSCSHREPFGAPKNVEKSSTPSASSHVNREASSLQYSSKLAHSPVYATGSCSKQSNNNSCSRREPFLIAKNVEKTSTSPLPSRSHCETSSSPPRCEPVQTPVYKTGNHSKPSCDEPHLCREPVLSGKNVEKISTWRSSSHNHSEISASSRNERTHSNMDKESMSSKSMHKPASISPLSKALLDFVQFPPEWRVGSTEQIIARVKVWESIRKTKAHSEHLGNPKSGGHPSLHAPSMQNSSPSPLGTPEQRRLSQNKVERRRIRPQDDHPQLGPGPSGGGMWSSQLPFGKMPVANAMAVPSPSGAQLSESKSVPRELGADVSAVPNFSSSFSTSTEQLSEPKSAPRELGVDISAAPAFLPHDSLSRVTETSHGLSMRDRDCTLSKFFLGKNSQKSSTFPLSSSERDTVIPSTHYGETHSDPPVQPTDKPPPREVKLLVWKPDDVTLPTTG
jgi:hypothetical protein